MFCKKCNSLLIPEKDDNGKVKFVCRKCGTSSRSKDLKIVSVKDRKERLYFVDKKQDDTLPSVRQKCPKCGNHMAYYWQIQTRAADEPETKFFRCTKCEHTWREYD
ncbi:Transcription factor S [Candidatus Tiddalikarchaeum anstoanum]|nr:Transcription factor S [Candidatus Tiddalikarchaeum anstoanum]